MVDPSKYGRATLWVKERLPPVSGGTARRDRAAGAGKGIPAQTDWLAIESMDLHSLDRVSTLRPGLNPDKFAV
jgi:hypothetical protein